MLRYRHTGADGAGQGYDIIDEPSDAVVAHLVFSFTGEPGSVSATYRITAPDRDAPNPNAIWFALQNCPVRSLSVAQSDGTWLMIGERPE